MTAPEQLVMPLASSTPLRGIASLGSGSRGNGTLIALDGTLLLVDCGFSLKETLARLDRLGVAAGQLAAILVTHEHSDHIAGVGRLARRFGIPVYASAGTIDGGGDFAGVEVNSIRPGRRFGIGAVEVIPVAVPHDAREPTQFVFEVERCRIGVLTDLGEIPREVAVHYTACDALLVEANHDRDMLWNGAYPYPLKRRIGGGRGHLANEQTSEFLMRAELSPEAAVIVGHLSQENNTPARVRGELAALTEQLPRLALATQDGGIGWHAVG
jgi:phosphoribosyl 1,2-cyclic phosphodiesterase